MMSEICLKTRWVPALDKVRRIVSSRPTWAELQISLEYIRDPVSKKKKKKKNNRALRGGVDL
jgi:hypothetical protein